MSSHPQLLGSISHQSIQIIAKPPHITIGKPATAALHKLIRPTRNRSWPVLVQPPVNMTPPRNRIQPVKNFRLHLPVIPRQVIVQEPHHTRLLRIMTARLNAGPQFIAPSSSLRRGIPPVPQRIHHHPARPLHQLHQRIHIHTRAPCQHIHIPAHTRQRTTTATVRIVVRCQPHCPQLCAHFTPHGTIISAETPTTNQRQHMLTFNDYQNATTATAIYPGAGTGTINALAYVGLGLGEAGEVQGKLKKVIRDNNSIVTDEHRHNIAAELGDVLWYVARTAAELDQLLAHINTPTPQQRPITITPAPDTSAERGR